MNDSIVDLFVKILWKENIFEYFYSIQILVFQTGGQTTEKIQFNLDQRFEYDYYGYLNLDNAKPFDLKFGL